MSKSSIRKITVDPTKCNTDSRRPSVFERLGTKPLAPVPGQNTSDYCRNWALNGSCSYGKTCKYASTHTLISPSKRAKKDTPNASTSVSKEDPYKRVTSKIVKKTSSHSPDLNIEEWNQTDLEYEDEKVLERRRQLLQRELELQMKKDKEVHTKDRQKHKKKAMTSSSSSHSSTSSSSSSTSSSEDSSSSSTSDSRKKLKKLKTKRHHSPSPDYEDEKDRKKKLKLKRLGAKTEKVAKKKRKIEPPKKELAKPVKKAGVPARKHSALRSKSPPPAPQPAKARNRSESPKPKPREPSKDRPKHLHRNSEEPKDPKSKLEKSKELEKSKPRISEDKLKPDDKMKQKSKSKERRSRTPPIKPQKSPLPLKRRSRTPEKRQKRESPLRSEKPRSTPSRPREPEKKERELRPDRSREREDSRKDTIKSRALPEDPRKTLRELDEKSRLRLKDHREERKDPRKEELHPRREKEREERPRERERELKDPKPLPASLPDKSRYVREKEKPKEPLKDDKLNPRDRRPERERDRAGQKFDPKYEKEAPRFRERTPEKSLHLEREIYDRNRHRRFTPRFEHERKELPKPERRESPRRNLEVDRNFDRSYPRLNEWDNAEEPHFHEEEPRRKNLENRRYSPFPERRREDRTTPRYPAQPERSFDEHHHHYPEREKLRPNLREETAENWDVHHEVEHNSRERYPIASAEWEEREWRPRPGLWERESLPRSEAHEEDWNQRYDSPMTEWKVESTNRKWENPALHLRANYRNERLKEMELDLHAKRRPYSTPEVEVGSHGSKQSSLHGSMKEEPINKKLMELAEGRPRRSREKSADSFQKKQLMKEKPQEPKELQPETKRPCLDESAMTHHTESDLSDISDDPDDILNMEDEENDKKLPEAEKESVSTPGQEPQESPEPVPEEPVFAKEKEEPEPIEEDNMETMDFEEISDGELEEDIKTSGKGLGDALGVDWESLVKESQPRRVGASQDSAQSRWRCRAIFQRIGVSARYAGVDFIKQICSKYSEDGEMFMLDDVAMVHAALFRERTADGGALLEDSLYRGDSDAEEDVEVLKPFVGLFEEAKMLVESS